MKQTTMNNILYKNSTFDRKKSRNMKFELIRRNKEMLQQESQQIILDYISFYPEDMQLKIKHSLNCPIPQQLPPLTLQTISLYRRSSKPIFQTCLSNFNKLDYHMACQSFDLLASLSKDLYPNYNGLVKQFQKQFEEYISSNSKQMFKRATRAAGNKVLGSQKDILSLVNKHPQQVWILINHCYIGKISFKYLQKFLVQGDLETVQLFYEFSNQKGHQSIYFIMDNEDIIESLFNLLKNYPDEHKSYVIRILGNICGQQSIQQAISSDIANNISVLLKFNILSYLFPIISSQNSDLRKDTYWLLSNLAFHEEAANAIVRHSKVLQVLILACQRQQKIQIKKTLFQIVYLLLQNVQNSLKPQLFRFFVNNAFFQLLSQSLTIQDNNIIQYVIGIIKKLIALGDELTVQKQQNIVVSIFNSKYQFHKNLESFQLSQNHQISLTSSEILQLIKRQSNLMQGQL